MIHLFRDPISGQYGLRQFRRTDGSYAHFLPIENDVRPDAIKGHGTAVILLGNDEKQNTIQPPVGSASPSRWISKYINTRYFVFPSGVTVKAREGWDYLHNSKEWTPDDITTALSEEALTTAVMQRYHIHFAVKRELSLKLGALNT